MDRVRSVAEHQVKAVERIDVTCMGAEHDARCDGLRILGDVVGLGVEGEKRLAHRQEELLQRGDGGRVIECDFLERLDRRVRMAHAALDGGDYLIGFQEGRHKRRELARVDNSIEHTHASLSRLGLLRARIMLLRQAHPKSNVSTSGTFPRLGMDGISCLRATVAPLETQESRRAMRACRLSDALGAKE